MWDLKAAPTRFAIPKQRENNERVPDVLCLEFETPWPASPFESPSLSPREGEVVHLGAIRRRKPGGSEFVSNRVRIGTYMSYSPSTKHQVYPMSHNLMLDKLVIPDLDEVWKPLVVIADALRHVEVIVIASFTIC
jgi:hypothetical protein